MADKARLSAGTWWLVALTAFLSALAYGAVWTLISSFFSRELPWLSVVVAIGMVWTVRSSTHRPSALGAVFAAVGTLVAAYYTECLSALTRLSHELGLSLVEALQHTSVRAAMHLGNISIHQHDVIWYLASAALALVISLRYRPEIARDAHG